MDERASALKKLRDDPVVFAEVALGFRAFGYQERLLRDPSKRIVSCMGRQSGKTVTIAVKAVHFAFTRPGTTTLIVSASLRQSMIMFGRVLGFVCCEDVLRASVVRKTRTVVQLSNGSQIIALPCNGNMLRGFTAHLVIVDEAAFVPEDVITQVVFPMLATTNGSLIMLSTPWGKDNVFYRAFMNPSYSVYKVRSEECPLISREFLEEQRRNMTEMAYRREYEAEFIENLNSYFPEDLIKSCIDPALEFINEAELL